MKVLALVLVVLSSFAYTSTAHDARAYKEDQAQFDVLRLCNKDLLLNCVGIIPDPAKAGHTLIAGVGDAVDRVLQGADCDHRQHSEGPRLGEPLPVHRVPPGVVRPCGAGRKSGQALRDVGRRPALESQCLGTCRVRPGHCFSVELGRPLESQWSAVSYSTY